MSYNFAVVGHGWNRSLFLKEGKKHVDFSVLAGGALVAEFLTHDGADVAPVKISSPVYTEHMSLMQIKSGGFAISGEFGITDGNTAMEENNADLYILWDEGLGALSVPEKGDILWASTKRLPPKEIFAKVKDRCLLMLTADVLRSAGALISKQISWERTVTDLVWQLQNNPRFGDLRGVPHMLVTFEEDGAVFIEQNGNTLNAKLVLAEGGFEGQLRERQGIDIPDTWAVMVAEAAISWKRWMDDSTGQSPVVNIGKMLCSACGLLQSGYTQEILKGKTQGILSREENLISFEFKVPVSSVAQQADPDYWCISSTFQGAKIQDLAFQYVLDGMKVIDGIPRFSCGALTTVDRKEIEAFQNIRSLIVGYANAPASRPLSIAVFGAPGSGKSFGVTQIAKNVLPGIVEKLEFNVSQMTSQQDMSAAFHQIRDLILQGKLPLVFFDEFDSDRNGQLLGWLKGFLMPMQDGKFKDESGEHPIGKCILVFAGGTSSSFEEFCAPMNPKYFIEKQDGLDNLNILKKIPEYAEREQHFKNIKGPDFVSRLRGSIDVLGPNQAGEKDQNFIMRRALLLRSLLERKLQVKGRMSISMDVLRAMLLIPKYKYGARSMEAVLDMSRIEGVSWEPASLPFYTQLSLHVDADAFIRLVLRDVVLGAYSETLARAIHDAFLAKESHKNYLAKQEGREVKTAPNQVPWEELSEEIRNSNREQALNIPKKLLLINCSFDAGDTPHPSVEQFTEEELLMLSQQEHIRWMAEKAANGWKYGAERDDEKKLHPCMIEWEYLPDYEQQKDFDVTENIIPLIKKAGLRVYRTV